ncbi:MAG: hypothetical protein VKK04_07545 [Synechococcales bacterium]|nr:hypothetical protein [Synechococcales bacterium]
MSRAAFMRIETPLNRAHFLLGWLLANLLGGFVAGFLENNGLQFAATLIRAGAIVGTLQWLVLRWVVRQVRWWPLASAVGWIVGTQVMIFSSSLYQPVVDFLWSSLGGWEVFWLNLVTGPIPLVGMAIAQAWVFSRNTRFSPKFIGSWILASTLAGAVRGGASAALCAAYCPILSASLVGLVDGMGWAAYGLITGMVLLRQLDEGDRT